MREAGVEMPKRTRKPSLKVAISRRKRRQKVCTYHYPTTIQGRLYYIATYQIYSKVQAKKKLKKLCKLLNQRGVYIYMSSLKTSGFGLLSRGEVIWDKPADACMRVPDTTLSQPVGLHVRCACDLIVLIY